MNKETLQRYAELEEHKRAIDAEQKQIKDEALSFMKEAGAEKIESDFGSLKIVGRKSWTYSEKVGALEDAVKSQKKAEEEDGTATAEVKESLTFYPIKH